MDKFCFHIPLQLEWYFCIFVFFAYTRAMHTTTLIDEILHALVADESITDKAQFQILRNSILAKTGESTSPAHIAFIERYSELVKSGIFDDDNRVRRVLRKRAVRSLSGVAVISLLTKFWGCPGKCIYCPTYE